MKLGIGVAFVAAVIFHGALLAVLAVNVSLEKPKRPEEKVGQIIHATIVNVPPAKGSPQGTAQSRPQMQDTAKLAEEAAAAAKAKAEAEAKRRAEELARQVAAQKKAEAERQKAIALKKAEEEKKRLEEQKRIEAEKKKAEEEAKKKAEAEAKKKAEEEAKKKAEAEAKKKAEEAKRKAEEEAKRKELAKIAEQMEREQQARQQAQAEAAANDLESDILGQANGVEGGVGLGQGTGSDDRVVYGSKVQQLIEQNWRIDPSMNGKRVVVTVSVDDSGMIYNEKCEGDRAVCASAMATLNLIGMLPRPPQGCKDCNTIVITMMPKL